VTEEMSTQSITFTVTRTGDITRSSSVIESGRHGDFGTDYATSRPYYHLAAWRRRDDATSLNVLGDYATRVTTIRTLPTRTGTGGGHRHYFRSPATTTIQDDDTAVSASIPSLDGERAGHDHVFTSA
jgi:hypothetical protein